MLINIFIHMFCKKNIQRDLIKERMKYCHNNEHITYKLIMLFVIFIKSISQSVLNLFMD